MKIRKGLHIDDDEAGQGRAKDEYQKLDADRHKGTFQKDLDSILFGGSPAGRRKRPDPASETKSIDKPKSPEVVKPVTPQVIKFAEQKPMTPQVTKITDSKTVTPKVTKLGEAKPATPILDTNKSPEQTTDGAKQRPILKRTREETGLQSERRLKEEIKSPEKKPVSLTPLVVPSTEQKKTVSVSTQPAKLEDIQFDDQVYPAGKDMLHHPGLVRKTKKAAEDYKFADQNINQNTAYDIVRPNETDRNKQRKFTSADFRDKQFPATSTSIGFQHREKPSIWKKPNELGKTVNFGKYIDPNDLRTGVLSSSHFVSTLSALAESQANIKRLIEDQKTNADGFYLIRLFINSVWRYVPVDSLLPFFDAQNVGVLPVTESEFELSSALIQKAYAKSFGGYDVFSKAEPREHYLRDLTGAPVQKYSSANSQVASIIKKAISSGHVILAVPTHKIAEIGINPNYSYAVINYNVKGNVELRNSWGIIEEKPKINAKNDGSFELTATAARDNISHFIIARVNKNYFTTTIQSRHKLGFYSSYKFTVRQQTQGFLTVSQWDRRLFPSSSGYEYSPFHLILHKSESQGSNIYINAAFTEGSRNLDLQVNLTPGTYTVFCAAQWKKSAYSYNLSFYGSQKIQFSRIYTQKLPNLISQSLENINIENGKKTELTKTLAQYLLHHAESNLVLITVENMSEKTGMSTIDLTKIKFEHLVLLTSHSNAENYGDKLETEIDEYKHFPITNRRWGVSLDGHERYTWILSPDQSYKEQNLKLWGFK